MFIVRQETHKNNLRQNEEFKIPQLEVHIVECGPEPNQK